MAIVPALSNLPARLRDVRMEHVRYTEEVENIGGKRCLPVLAFAGISFALHLLWENIQAPFFQDYISFTQHFPICLKGTITGDMLFMLIIYAALGVVHRDPLWISNRSSYSHPATWILPIVIGILLAVNMELWALFVDQRWQYTDRMPIIPILRIGLTPVLQMIVVPFLSLLLTSRFSRVP